MSQIRANNTETSHLFISYAREDQSFVRSLAKGLEQAQRRVWVDWTKIHPAAEWWEEIRSAITEATAFAFVISPDSVASLVCRQELDYAIAQGKRLIPILYRDAEHESVPAPLSRLQYLNFLQQRSLDELVRTLTETLDTTLEWVRQHTRIAVRATEWENGSRDESYLLRGNDLRQAEESVLQGAMLEPSPTELHTQYIAASRAAARKRRRTFLIVAGVAGAVVIGLGILFGTARIEARRQEAVAIAQQQLDAAKSAAAITLSRGRTPIVGDLSGGRRPSIDACGRIDTSSSYPRRPSSIDGSSRLAATAYS